MFGICQSHPMTIASTPTSHGDDVVFFLQARHSFTRRIQAGCTRVDCICSSIDSEKELALSARTYLALIDGPYGGNHLDFAAFDTLVLIADTTGATFTLSILQDLVSRVSNTETVTQKGDIYLGRKNGRLFSGYHKSFNGLQMDCTKLALNSLS